MTAIILFYVLCLLYVISTTTFVCDLMHLIISVSINSINSIIFFFISCAAAVAYQYTTAPNSN